jgi:type IV secretory pathway TrbF-like protein
MDTPNDGSLAASDYTDHLDREDDASEAEIARIQHVYSEIERRDGAALWHARAWRSVAWLLAVALLGCVGVTVSLALKASRVQAFVQPVQITDEGQMVLIGIPQDLLAYQPADAQWMDMLAQWVTKRYWRGDDDAMKRTRNDWAWLYRHTCGAGSKQLASDEVREQPFTPSKGRTSIDIKSLTKTATPESYQVLWHEVRIDKLAATIKEQEHTSTFTVGRLKPKSLADAIDNRLGLCVTGYDTSISPRTP